MSQFSHYPFKDDITGVVITYPNSGKHESYAVLHAEGCSHTARASQHGGPRKLNDPLPSPEDPYHDDYYVVAPCLRARGAKPHLLDH